MSVRSLSSRISRFALFECTSDLSHLSSHEHTALKSLVKAGQYFDTLYMRQAWSGNEALRKKVHDEGNKELITLFEMYKGPWVIHEYTYIYIYVPILICL